MYSSRVAMSETLTLALTLAPVLDMTAAQQQ